MNRPLIVGLLALSVAVRADLPVVGEEFSRMSDSFGVLETIAGVGGNEDPLDNNDWLPQFEGAVATEVELSNPHMAAGDALGNVFIADKASHAILRISSDGRLHTHAGTHTAGNGSDASAPAISQALSSPNGLFVKPNGTVFLYDSGNRRIRRVGTNGMMTTVVNDPHPTLGFSIGRGLWVSPDESLIYFTDGTVVRKSLAGVLTTVATGFLELGNLDVSPSDGLVYVTDRASDDPAQSAVWRLNADGTRTRVAGNGATSGGGDGEEATATSLNQVRGICFTREGGYFLCTHKGADIWYVDIAGIIHRYIAGRGNANLNEGDGQHPPITSYQCFSEPRSVMLAPNGDLLICTNDTGYVRRVRTACFPPAPEWNSAELLPAGFRIRWVATPGTPYVVERSADGTNGSWAVVGVPTAGATVAEFMDQNLNGAARHFYRVSPPR